MTGFFIALISGALMSVQGVFNTQVTKASGIWVANAFVQFTALLVCLGAWLFADRSSFGELFKVEPKYMLLGGVMGGLYHFYRNSEHPEAGRGPGDHDYCSGAAHHRVSH